MTVGSSEEISWSRARAPLWDELDELLRESAHRRSTMSVERVDLLVLRYQQAAADLATLRTHHPASQLIPRLNDLVARGSAEVYRRRGRFSWASVGGFFWNGYPRLVWEIRRYVYACAALEIALVVAGFAWALHDPVAAASFLPGDLRDAAHFQHHPIAAGVMSTVASSIFTNNIIVSFTFVAGGLTAGVMTLYSIYLNSMLLGVLSGLTNQHSVNGQYWSLILPHGVIELTVLTICGGAGLNVAAAIIRGGRETRAQAIKRTATRAVLIAVGTMPLLVIAGTIEGFVTPSGLPIAAKLAVAPVTGLLLALYLRRGIPRRDAVASRSDAVSATPATV